MAAVYRKSGAPSPGSLSLATLSPCGRGWPEGPGEGVPRSHGALPTGYSAASEKPFAAGMRIASLGIW
jgi:hypothetical protein